VIRDERREADLEHVVVQRAEELRREERRETALAQQVELRCVGAPFAARR
jgi:hypothetical protein